jgi:hypothetical protein
MLCPVGTCNFAKLLIVETNAQSQSGEALPVTALSIV